MRILIIALSFCLIFARAALASRNIPCVCSVNAKVIKAEEKQKEGVPFVALELEVAGVNGKVVDDSPIPDSCCQASYKVGQRITLEAARDLYRFKDPKVVLEPGSRISCSLDYVVDENGSWYAIENIQLLEDKK